MSLSSMISSAFFSPAHNDIARGHDLPFVQVQRSTIRGSPLPSLHARLKPTVVIDLSATVSVHESDDASDPLCGRQL